MGYVKKNNKTKSDLWLTIVCIVLVVVVVASIVTAALSNTGVFLRISDAVATENYEVNGAMMSYFFNEELSSWVNNNATMLQYAALYPSYDYFADYNINFSGDLDAQKCALITEVERTEDYTSWYDYFMKLTVDTVTRYLEYAEGAKIAGVSLDDEDNNNIKETLNSLTAELKANGYKLEDVYGAGVTKNDVKKCLELKELAIKYANIKIEELKGVLEKDDKDVFAYPDLEEHKSEFYSAKYISYTIQKKEADFKTDAEYEAAKAEAKAAADLIAKAETPELFFEAIMKYEEESKKADAETATGTETTTTTAATTDAPEMEDYTKEVFYNTGTSALDKWLFEENAEAGASKVIEETETTTTKASTTTKATEETTTEETTRTTNEIYKVTAYKVIKSNDINRDKTFNLGYVVTTDKAIAERILNDFNAGGTLTAEALKKLGEAEAAKLAEGAAASVDANTQENAMPEYFKGYSESLHDWLNSKDLKKGTNSGIIEVKPTQDGQKTQYIICHFDDHGDEVWYAEAFDLVMEERFEAWFEDMKVKMPTKEKANTLEKMTVSTYVINMVSSITSSTSSSIS